MKRTFHKTLEELKSGGSGGIGGGRPPFHKTLEELKLLNRWEQQRRQPAFHKTLEELKLMLKAYGQVVDNLSIKP